MAIVALSDMAEVCDQLEELLHRVHFDKMHVELNVSDQPQVTNQSNNHQSFPYHGTAQGLQ